jgi:ankyrin repeat protein
MNHTTPSHVKFILALLLIFMLINVFHRLVRNFSRPQSTQGSSGKAGISPLYRAAAGGDLEAVRQLATKSPGTMNEKFKNDKIDGWTPLDVAIDSGHEDIAAYLITAGADINHREKRKGTTPLISAASRGQERTVGLLIEKGADVNAVTSGGESALLRATQKGNKRIAEDLLAHGARTDATGYENFKAPLNEAITLGDMEIVGLLVEKGARVDSRSLEDAASRGQTELLKYLIEHGLVKNGGNRHTTSDYYIRGMRLKNTESGQISCLLHYAALGGHDETVRYLVGLGCKVDAFTIYDATSKGHIDTAKYLTLKAGAIDWNKGPDGMTPLHEAASKGFIDLVKMFVARGAGVNAKSYQGQTPLWCAASENHREIAAYLLARKADINANGSKGTPLLAAIYKGHRDMVKFLVDHGADIYEPSEAGKSRKVGSGKNVRYVKVASDTPLSVARERGFKDIERLLIERGAESPEKK